MHPPCEKLGVLEAEKGYNGGHPRILVNDQQKFGAGIEPTRTNESCIGGAPFAFPIYCETY